MKQIIDDVIILDLLISLYQDTEILFVFIQKSNSPYC